MYNAQITKTRIKTRCNLKNISIESMLTHCGLGINAVRQIKDNKGMASISLAKIADYLECSVDYLLGRTDEPTGDTHLNTDEKKLVTAYRNKPEMKSAVDKLLGLDNEENNVVPNGVMSINRKVIIDPTQSRQAPARVAAFGSGPRDVQAKDISPERLRELEKEYETDE